MAASIIGYVLGAALMLNALLKLIHPRAAGLWAYPSSTGDLDLSLRMGFGGPPLAPEMFLVGGSSLSDY